MKMRGLARKRVERDHRPPHPHRETKFKTMSNAPPGKHLRSTRNLQTTIVPDVHTKHRSTEGPLRCTHNSATCLCGNDSGWVRLFLNQFMVRGTPLTGSTQIPGAFDSGNNVFPDFTPVPRPGNACTLYRNIRTSLNHTTSRRR